MVEFGISRKFNRSDVVSLKSGGAKMTIVKYTYNPYTYITNQPYEYVVVYSCIWFDTDNHLQSNDFYEHCLESAKI